MFYPGQRTGFRFQVAGSKHANSFFGSPESGAGVTAAVGSAPSVSGYLNEIEGAIKYPIIRGRRTAPKTDALHTERENGKRRASVRDFHSLRVTWITLALAAGMPLELVQRVTGHRTVAVVLKHYFNPAREDFRHVILKAMPRILTGGVGRSPRNQTRDILERMIG